MKRLLFIIDPQIDFTSKNGSLYVPGSEDAMQFLSEFIKNQDISDICVSQDTHDVYHVGHALYWENDKGNHPTPFTQFSDTSVWKPTKAPIASANKYLSLLKQHGRVNTIWPNHCIEGTKGWEINPILLKALNGWNIKRQNQGLKGYYTYRKGFAPDSEMFSILSSFDGQLVDFKELPVDLKNYDEVLIAGVAGDVCVAETIHDLIKLPYLKNKISFLKEGIAFLDRKAEAAKIYEDAIYSFGAKYI